MSTKSSRYFQKIPGLAKYGMVLLTIVLISFLFPNNAKFKYNFEEGQSWRYEDLRAPFDFAIRKSDQELEAEVNSANEDQNPYYEMDLGKSIEKRQRFDQLFDQQLEIAKQEGQYNDVIRRPSFYSAYAHQLINRLYDRGVVELDDAHLNKDKSFVINVVKGNTTSPQTFQNLLTPTLIDADLTDTLFESGLKEAEFLIPLLKNFFSPNLIYNDSLTARFRDEIISSISKSRGMIRKGELIIPQNGIVTEEIYQTLHSFQTQYELEISERKSHLGVFGGYFLLTSLIIGAFLLYLQYNEKSLYNSFRQLTFILLWLLIYSYLTHLLERHSILSAYMIPYCIIPIVISIFYNERLALFTHIVVVLIASFLSSQGYEFTFLQILAGIVAILSSIDIRDSSRFFFSMIYIFLAYALGFLGLSLIKDGSLASVDWSIYQWIFLNVFLTLLAYPLIPLLERIFGFISPIKLIELSDMNRPLLRELSIKAPGTLQHSLQVANLAEAAATRIGADDLLVKVAALYHDIGKMARPSYFIENQSGNNPHDDLNELESAKIIIAHVEEGVKLARKHNLPEVFIDFIKTHHGNTRVEYFYRNYEKDHPFAEVNEQQFCYSGPRPKSKEETILMLADSLEAASKSLQSPTEEDINELVEKITDGKIQRDQFQHSRLTFHELESCKIAFKKLLKSIHHVRIEYPEEKG